MSLLLVVSSINSTLRTAEESTTIHWGKVIYQIEQGVTSSS